MGIMQIDILSVKQPSIKETKQTNASKDKSFSDFLSENGEPKQLNSNRPSSQNVQNKDVDSSYSLDSNKRLNLNLEKEEETVEELDLSTLVNTLMLNISERLGTNIEVVKDYVISNDFTFENLLDINSFKSLIISNNQLNDISAMLTNDTAFKQFEEISNIITEYSEFVKMGQTTTRTTEGIAEILTTTSTIKPTLIEQKTNEIPVKEEDIKIDSFSNNIDKIEPKLTLGITEEDSNAEADTKEDILSSSKDISTREIPITDTKIFKNIVDSIEKLDENSINQGVDRVSIIEQVKNQITRLHTPDKMSLELTLNPERLGKVFVNVSSKNGLMYAEIRVETAEAKIALENQIADLKLNFENQGIKVENVSIMLAEGDIGSGTDNGEASTKDERQKNKKNKGFVEVLSSSEENTDPRLEMLNYTEDTGRSINFSA